MRLFKFLVISDEVMQDFKEMVKPVLRTKEAVYNFKTVSTKNEFFFVCPGVDDLNINLLSQNNIKGSKDGFVLMSIDYPNELLKFTSENKAYVIIDPDNVDAVMDGISPLQEHAAKSRFKTSQLKVCSRCTEMKKSCFNKKISVELPVKASAVRGKTWSFANDKAGTKYLVTEKVNEEAVYKRNMEPKTGGIAYSSVQWDKDKRPAEFDKKTVTIPLYHWVKCHSLPKQKPSGNDYSFYPIGHTFDYRNGFIGLATVNDQETLRKKEPQNSVYRGKRVLAGQEYHATSLDCDCGLPDGKPKCRDCKGVLYIDTKLKLVELYEKLTSDEYKQLTVGKVI